MWLSFGLSARSRDGVGWRTPRPAQDHHGAKTFDRALRHAFVATVSAICNTRSGRDLSARTKSVDAACPRTAGTSPVGNPVDACILFSRGRGACIRASGATPIDSNVPRGDVDLARASATHVGLPILDTETATFEHDRTDPGQSGFASMTRSNGAARSGSPDLHAPRIVLEHSKCPFHPEWRVDKHALLPRPDASCLPPYLSERLSGRRSCLPCPST